MTDEEALAIAKEWLKDQDETEKREREER